MDLKVDLDALAREVAADVARPLREPDARYGTAAAQFLEKNGWTQSVAGREDFAAAVHAYAKAAANRRIGMFVWGAFGCGKTALVHAMTDGLAIPPTWINLGNPEDVERLDVRDWPNWNREALRYSVVLDDLGAEATVSDFGVRRELAGEFIVRYHLAGKGRLFVTTNLTGEELDARYTMRVCSRLKDLTIPLHLKGADKRRWAKGNRQLPEFINSENGASRSEAGRQLPEFINSENPSRTEGGAA